MADVTIGGLEPADKEAWKVLFVGYNAFYERTLPDEVYECAWQEFQTGDRMHALGAYVDSRLVGIAHFLVHPSTTSDDVCYLQDLFTAPESRGRGVARALIEAVEHWARDRGCARLYWHTQESNATARRLYDQLALNRGFILYTLPLSTT